MELLDNFGVEYGRLAWSSLFGLPHAWKLRDGRAVWFDNYVDPVSPLRALEREGAS
jgi:hypothetical protein